MKCNLLCPGPSLVHYVPREGLTIGVNRAACAYKCDWWVFLDFAIFRDWRATVIGKPSIYTTRNCVYEITRRGLPNSIAEYTVKTLDDNPTPKTGWTLLSSCAALVLSKDLGFDEIDVFGADWTDSPDYDGVKTIGMNRGANRWNNKERPWWNNTIAALGITVTRIKHGE